MAEFDSPAAILRAAEKIRDAGYRRWDVFTPFPIHGFDRVMGFKNSLVGWFALVFGGGAFVATLGLIWFTNTFDYPLIVGGKPMFSPPAAFVPSYILMVLGGAVGAFVGMLVLNGLPRLYHPLFAEGAFCAGVARQVFPRHRRKRPEIFRNRNAAAARIHRRHAHRRGGSLMRQLLYIILILLTVAAVGVGIAGRRGRLSRKPPIEIFPDMDRQLKLRPAAAQQLFPERPQFAIAAARHGRPQ